MILYKEKAEIKLNLNKGQKIFLPLLLNTTKSQTPIFPFTFFFKNQKYNQIPVDLYLLFQVPG